MTVEEVKALLEANKNEIGMKQWEEWNLPWTA